MRRWRRMLLIAASALLFIVVGLIGVLIWLQSSGRLTRYAQELAQAYSGQNVSFDAVAFTSWNVIAVTNVRLQHALPGWRLEVAIPRLEARYTLQGLRRKQVSAVHLIRPTAHLQTSEIPVGASGEAPTMLVLPVERLLVQDAALRVDRGEALYTLNQIELSMRQLSGQRVALDVRAQVGDGVAEAQIRGNVSLDLANPSGTFDVHARQVSAPKLAAKGFLPSGWTLAEGSAEVIASPIELRGQTLRGALRVELTRGQGDIASVALQGAAMSAEMVFEADLESGAVDLKGPVQLRADTALQASSGLKARQLTARLPLQLTYESGRWRVHADIDLQGEQIDLAGVGAQLRQFTSTVAVEAQSAALGWSLKGDLAFAAPRAVIAAMQLEQVSGKTPLTFSAMAPGEWRGAVNMSLQSRAVRAGGALKLKALSGQLPLDVSAAPRGWTAEGAARLQAESLRLGGANPLTLEQAQSRLPLRFAPGVLQFHGWRLQAKTASWRPGGGRPSSASSVSTPLELRGDIAVNLQQRQIEAGNLAMRASALGRMTGGGVWRWENASARDVRLAIAPASLETIWPYLTVWLPAPYAAWAITGKSRIDLRMPRLTWRAGRAPAQPLDVTWRFSNIAFSSPDGGYAGENISGQMAANISLAPDWRPASAQASLHLQPFAFLAGGFFPELESNRIVSKIRLNSARDAKTGHFDVELTGDFGPLGRLTAQGRLDGSRAPMRADIACRLHRIDVAKAWQTFMPQTLRQAAEPPAMRGWLSGRLQLRGSLAEAQARGEMQLSAFYLQSPSLNLQNLSLRLPLDVRYPLPEASPNVAALPASAYGQLHLEQLRYGALQIPGVSARLALRSDSIIFQEHMQASLLKGVVHLRNLVAYRLLQPQRLIELQMQLRGLRLSAMPRGDDALPLAGEINADFSRLRFHDGRLQTEGAMRVRVAGGRIRIGGVKGWDLLSPIPSLQSSFSTEEPLSLLKLTQLYPIGRMGGALHFTVDDFTLTAGEPAAFRLRFHVQEKGGEARQISLRALNNILFTTGSARVATSFTNELPYRRFGAELVLRNDMLRLRGLYKDRQGREYFMRAPALGSGISIVNERPKHNSIAFRSFVQRLKSTILEGPEVKVK